MVDVVTDQELRSGSFERQESRFREWVGLDLRSGGHSRHPVCAGRYHLYISLACPWCHRAAIVHALAGIGEAVEISYVAPFRDERGWAFTGEGFDDGPGGEYVDPINGWHLVAQAYRASDPSFEGRVTVPVLWDRRESRILNNESSEIMRMLASPDSLGALGTNELDHYPEDLQEEIDRINERVYDTVNNGVYRAGFAREQAAYEQAFEDLFESLAWLDEILSERRYLAGARITEADWRLLPTLVRFDEVYHTHFRCNHRRIVEYPSLWAYARELYQWPGVAQTVAMDQIKRHYYTTHQELNPKRIIPLGPRPQWWQEHGRS